MKLNGGNTVIVVNAYYNIVNYVRVIINLFISAKDDGGVKH